MKWKLIIFSGVMALSLLMMSSRLNAFGLGLYGTATKGSTDWTMTNQDTDYETEQSSDVSKLGLGFTLDTALAFDKLFNYRLHVGYSKINIDREEGLLDIEGLEFHLYNTFGFGVFRSELVRIWLGPQIGFGIINAEYDTDDDLDTNEYITFYASLGLIAGINFNIGDISTISIDGGYRFNRHTGESTVESSTYSYSWDITGKGKEAFIDISFMFRLGDTF